ncbi:MAG: ABC transporter permease [Cyclobacteriaceae bacterium]|nr:ABC transporter permease [Cyclobacteriaceae bacterium]
MSRNREIYLLKITTLTIAFASSILITLFSLNEFGFDRFHKSAGEIFRVLQKNTDEKYSGNRLSVKIPSEVFNKLKGTFYNDSLIVSRVKIMNKVNALVNNKSFYDQKVHAADPEITNIFSFETLDGNMNDFITSDRAAAMISSRVAQSYFGKHHAVGKKIKLYTFNDTVEVRIAAVYKDFPINSHEDFDVFISFNEDAIKNLNFDPKESGIYGRTIKGIPKDYTIGKDHPNSPTIMKYSFQPLPELYFGSRVLGEEARHGDKYSVIILICIAGLILFLSFSTFINLTTITLPYRSKELAIKKLSGTSQANLLYGFYKESFAFVGTSLLIGLLMIVAANDLIASTLNLQVLPLFFTLDVRLVLIISILLFIFTVSPVFMTMRFVKATPNRLLSTDTITFPRLKRMITFFQLGISIFLIIASIVVKRQINYSLVKEPGQNHDQIVYLNPPSGLTNEGIMGLRNGWKKYNPNILDVMAVSQLPDRIVSGEIGSDFYLLQVDPGFKDFFNLRMKEGYWLGPNSGDSVMVINKAGKELIGENQANVIGVVDDLSGLFNQPEKPLKISVAQNANYNWLCVRVLEVDIRRTVTRLSEQFSSEGKISHVKYLNSHFKQWIEYQDRLNKLSGILAIVSGLLSCFAIYGLSVSLVRDKLKEIAIHKLLGARTIHVTYLLVRELVIQMIFALAVFGPIAYILLNELLRTFVFSTKFMWLDPVYPIAYCVFVIVIISGFQAMSLNRANFASALKS